ncbi:enolase C-terminal domain-like protein, partial [Streptomyces anthocyanicus]
MTSPTGQDTPALDECVVDAVDVHAFEVPTDGPEGREQDGTLEWDATTLVLVRVHAGGRTGLGYTYGDVSVASFVHSVLGPAVKGRPVSSPPALWERMGARMRNAGRPGVGAMALSAVDVALWDLKARLLGLPLVHLLPAHHDRVPVYGSGGFTNYPLDRLTDQLAGWVRQGIGRVKLKTSRDPEADPRRLTAVRRAVGDAPELFTDANGALGRKEALYWAHRFHDEWDVRWFEEPVASADLEGLRMLRERGPARLEITAGEYAFTAQDFANLTEGPAVDCLQADVTRCGGVTGVLEVAGLSAARHLDLSAHCAPA